MHVSLDGITDVRRDGNVHVLHDPTSLVTGDCEDLMVPTPIRFTPGMARIAGDVVHVDDVRSRSPKSCPNSAITPRLPDPLRVEAHVSVDFRLACRDQGVLDTGKLLHQVDDDATGPPEADMGQRVQDA
jgi:hypothetical protein